MLHFSEDPTIERFVPQPPSYYVWAVDHDRAPDYWFPRQCPRAMAWVGAGTSEVDRERIIGVGCGVRVHAIEYAWWDAMRSIRLYAYRFSAAAFRPLVDHAQVATAPVVPLGPAEPVGDLIEAHEAAGIQLRVLANLWPFLGRGHRQHGRIQRHSPAQRPEAAAAGR